MLNLSSHLLVFQSDHTDKNQYAYFLNNFQLKNTFANIHLFFNIYIFIRLI
ncbi:hypothetical protein F952_02064 [Acinetobacter baylyi DSM 14961 = CIP 107474]|nr:hypothetical protein F952_02064 [Acinetobacter baylyi DSM 14961 = CIP 107474]